MTDSTTFDHRGPSIRQIVSSFLVHPSLALPDYADPWCLITSHPHPSSDKACNPSEKCCARPCISETTA